MVAYSLSGQIAIVFKAVVLFPFFLQTRTALLKWEDKEAKSRQSGFNQAFLEAEENQSFGEFVKNYEQAYMYREDHNESGR